MDLVGSIIAWVIGLPVALILGCFFGVGAFLLHRAYHGNQIARHRILTVSAVAALAGFLGVVLALDLKWLLLDVVFVIPLLFGNIMGLRTVTDDNKERRGAG